MQCTFAASFCGPDTQPYNWIKQTIAKWIAVDCLPYKIVEMRAFRAMTRSLDPKCPNFGRKAISSQVGHCPKYYLVLPAFFNMFFSIIEVANACTGEWSYRGQKLRNEHYVYICCVYSCSQVYFWAAPL